MAHILLADDDLALRGFLRAALEKDGHKVTAAADGQEAMEELKDNKSFDLLLTDIVMPHMDGLELARQAQRLYPHLKIMFITGFSGLATGNSDTDQNTQVISKPFHLKDIVAQVNQNLANKALPNA